ncbi:MAG: WG repeat-containing protein [Bacteroidota bacterium]
MVRKLLILVFLGISVKHFSQLKIVKDNIACTYGLKDQQGKWVIPATYVLIEELHTVYRITTAEGRGIMDNAGKVVVEPEYDAIDLLNTGFFKACLKNKYALLNKQGKPICMLAYTNIIHDPYGIIMLYKYENSTYKTTCIDTAGNILIPEVQGYIPAFGANSFALIGQYPGHDGSISGDAGVIDRNGNLMVPREYEFLKYCNSRLVFRKNYKTGVIDLSNNVLLEPKYTIVTADGSTPCIRETDVLRIMDDKYKTGFMRGNGEILLEPFIDELIPLYNEQQSKKAHSLFRTNGKMGIISDDYKITVEAIYDTLVPRNRIGWNDPYNSQKKKRLCFQFIKNGKQGLMKDDGTIICEGYDSFLRSDYAKKPAYFVSKGLDLYLLDYEQDSIIPEKAKLVARHDTLLIFESRGELLPCFIRKKAGQIAAMGSEHMEYRTNGVLFYVATRAGYSYFTTDGKAFLKNRIRYMDFSTGKYALLTTRSGKRGLYSLNRQKMIIDTLYENINAGYAVFNQVWAMLPYQVDKAATYIWNPMDANARQMPFSEWVLLDTNGRRLSKGVFDGIVQQRDTTVAYSKGLSGLVDININWLVPPGYAKVLRIGKNQVAVYTVSGKYGIVSLQNKIIVDTIYTDIREVYAGVYSDWKRFPSRESADYQRWYLFRNENQQVLFSDRGEILVSSKTADAKKIEQLLMELAFRGASNSSSSALKISTLLHQDSLLPALAFRKELYGMLKGYHDTLRFCNPLEMVPNPLYRVPDHCYGTVFPYYSLKSLGKNYVSVESTTPYQRNHWDQWSGDFYLPRNSYENRIWKNGQLEKISLKKLFPDVEVLEGELIRTLQERDDLQLSCTSPANILEQIGENFSLSKQGLILYYQEGYTQVEFMISTERLRQNAGAKWIVDYLD